MLLLFRWRPVLGYGRLKKMLQGKDTLNEKQSLPCWRWRHGPLFLLHRFLWFVLLLLLYHSDKLAIHHYHMFLLLQILHLVLFKLLQRQDEMSISGDSRVVFWWVRDGNRRLSFLRRSDLPFWGEDLLLSISDCQFQKNFLPVLQLCGKNFVVIGGRSTPFGISECAIDLVDGAQCKCKLSPGLGARTSPQVRELVHFAHPFLKYVFALVRVNS